MPCDATQPNDFGSFAFMATLTLVASCLSIPRAVAAQPLTTATLDPQQITLGQSTTLTVTLTGNQPQQFNMPQVEGLEFGMVGQSHRVEIINGAILTSTITYHSRYTAVGGHFHHPRPHSPVATADPARKSRQRQRRERHGAQFNTVPGALLGAPNAEGIRMAADGAAFVRLVLPKRDVYVGESVPVEIEVGARDGFARPNGLPTLTSSEFTLNNLTRSPENSAESHRRQDPIRCSPGTAKSPP